MSKKKRMLLLLLGISCLLVFCVLWLGVRNQASWLHVLDDFGFRFTSTDNTFLTTILTNVTKLGDYIVVIGLTLIFTIIIFFKQKSISIWYMGMMAVCGGLIPYLLKELIRRPRPEIGLIERAGYSFPSGHGAGATMFYGLLIVLVIYFFKSKWVRSIVIAFSTLVIMLVMTSRVHLQVHYLSDVLGSLFLGLGQILCSVVLFYDRIVNHKVK
jgi:undecaprenyl-diphosphatase